VVILSAGHIHLSLHSCT